METTSHQASPDLVDAIRRVLDRNRLAVLATQYEGQPHASLMAFTPFDGLRYIILATYRGTRKYRSMRQDGRVALLVDDGDAGAIGIGRRLVITAIGEAVEIPEGERPAYMAAHLERHPDLEEFLRSPDSALLRVAVRAYQVVGGIGDVHWYYLDGPAVT